MKPLRSQELQELTKLGYGVYMGQKGLLKDVLGFLDRVGIYRFFKRIENEKN